MNSWKLLIVCAFSALLSVNRPVAAQTLDGGQTIIGSGGYVETCESITFSETIKPPNRDVSSELNAGARLGLKLTNPVGTVKISSSNSPELQSVVHIEAEKKVTYSTCVDVAEPPEYFLSQLGLSLFEDANELYDVNINVESQFPNETPAGVSLSIDYVIVVPKTTGLDVANEVGGLDVRDISAPMDLGVGVGGIEAVIPEPRGRLGLSVNTGTVALALPVEGDFTLNAAVTTGTLDPGPFPLDVKYTLIGGEMSGSVKNGTAAEIELSVMTGSARLFGM